MFNSTSLPLKTGHFFPFCYESKAAAFWFVSLLPGLFVHVVLDERLYCLFKFKKKTNTLTHLGVATGKFTSLGLFQCQTGVHLRKNTPKQCSEP